MKRILQKIPLRYYICFFAALVIGLLAHAMTLVNKYSFHDDINQLFGAGSTYPSGRWMLGVLFELEQTLWGSGTYSIPVVNGMVSIVLLGLTACLMIYLLDIKRTAVCIGVGGIIVSFPVVCGMFGYMFTAHYYMFALLMAVGGTVLMCKSRKWYLLATGILLDACAIGVYQAFIPVILSVAVLWVISKAWNGEMTWPRFLLECGKLLLTCLGAVVVYFALNKLFLAIKDVELVSYQGISSMGSESVGTYLKRILTAFMEFLRPTTQGETDMFPFRLRWLYWISFGLAALGILLRMVHNGAVKGLQLLLPVAVLPLACNFIYVMCDQETIHSLMLFGQVGFLLLVALLADRMELRVLGSAAAAVLLLCSVMFVRLDNALYLRAEFEQTRAVQYFTTMVTQIKSCEGYESQMPVAFVGLGNNQDSTVKNISQFNALRITPYRGMEGLVDNYVAQKFVERWCGFNPTYAPANQYAQLPEVEAMPCYPDDGSIRIISGTVVVKISH